MNGNRRPGVPPSGSGPSVYVPPQAPPNNYAPPHTINAPPPPVQRGGMHMDSSSPVRYNAPPAPQAAPQINNHSNKKKAPPVPQH